MANRVNLKFGARDYTREILAILSQLRDGPRLASELPQSASALIQAEAEGLCSAQCIERHNSGLPSIWRWSITPAGKQWLKAHPTPKARSRSVFDAEVRMGELSNGLKAIPPKESGAARGNPGSPPRVLPAAKVTQLSEIGITKQRASEYEKIAAMPNGRSRSFVALEVLTNG